MQDLELKVLSNKAVNENTYELTLEYANADKRMRAGQFVEIMVDGCTLRRPFSVASLSENSLTVIYKTVGEGTEKLRDNYGDDKLYQTLLVLTELGNGFDLSKSKSPLLVGGGIGCAPLYRLACEFKLKGVTPTLLLCYRNSDEVFYKNKFENVGNVFYATDDGSLGYKGNAVDALKALRKERKVNDDFYYACGPAVMLNRLAAYDGNGQISMEARMGCGFGACMGCSIKTVNGFRRICKEGPVFFANEIIFE